ncbi:MAG: hypothetical protein OSB57_12940 [Planctomycetota bacterium]|nr:hypothetical protein [Planctomycetota bacterium]
MAGNDPNGRMENLSVGRKLPNVGESYSYKLWTREVREIRVEATVSGMDTWIIFKPSTGRRRRTSAAKWIRWEDENGPRVTAEAAEHAREARREELAARPLQAKDATPPPTVDGINCDTHGTGLTFPEPNPELEESQARAKILQSHNDNLRAALEMAQDAIRDSLGGDGDE